MQKKVISIVWGLRLKGKVKEIPSDGKVEINNKNFSITIDEAAPFTLEGLDENFKEKVRANRLEQEIDQEESSPSPPPLRMVRC
ncbi:hypothetical protein CDO51_07025 [Natranaerobius trueperi]|uniref:Uncharacterized protein n=1 Tax=Natranaerobius trueperi TaxID=759412 RepID=A0A226BXD5_9FIRM|nr:hypothetical protein CDO51_07025 [Natranaerobius trueperi]